MSAPSSRELYPEGGARLDSGFTIFYIGINVGAVLGPLVTGEAQVLFGARAGFGAAARRRAVRGSSERQRTRINAGDFA